MERRVIRAESMKKPAPAPKSPSCLRDREENHELDCESGSAIGVMVPMVLLVVVVSVVSVVTGGDCSEGEGGREVSLDIVKR